MGLIEIYLQNQNFVRIIPSESSSFFPNHRHPFRIMSVFKNFKLKRNFACWVDGVTYGSTVLGLFIRKWNKGWSGILGIQVVFWMGLQTCFRKKMMKILNYDQKVSTKISFRCLDIIIMWIITLSMGLVGLMGQNLD